MSTPAPINLDAMIREALTYPASSCRQTITAPIDHFRPDQVTVVPYHIRGLVNLIADLYHRPECKPNVRADPRLFPQHGEDGMRYEEFCALRKVVEAMVRDALELPLGTNIGLYADWIVITVKPEDQMAYSG